MPRVQVNRPALWTLATCGVIVGFAALAAVGALTTLGPGDDSGQDDPLTALALLLAILAFVVQIFVYAFQTGQSNAATRRGEELNTETRGALNEIRANSAATQKVLFSQFDRLLDYVVGPEAAARGDEAAQEVDEPESAPEEEGPATASEIRRLLETRLGRPTFSARVGQSEEDSRILEALMTPLDRTESADVVARLQMLSPLAIAKFMRLLFNERTARRHGSTPGFKAADGDHVALSSKELINEGLAEFVNGRVRLTGLGRRVAQLFAQPKDEQPDWWEEVTAPLRRRPGNDAP